MSSKAVRILFILFLIWLPVQYGLVGIVGVSHSEPWPAFVFPGFKNVYVYDEGFEIDQTIFEVRPGSSGAPVRLLPHELFPALPRSQIAGFMRSHFRDEEGIERVSPEARQWLRQHAEQATGMEPSSMDVIAVKKYYSRALEEMEPDSIVEMMRVTVKF